MPHFIAQFGLPGDPAMTGPNTRTTQVYISLVDNARLDHLIRITVTDRK